MVNFWDGKRKIERLKILERIQHAQKHGIGKMVMDEKQRLKEIDRIIELRKNK